jgi:hypothetical protein
MQPFDAGIVSICFWRSGNLPVSSRPARVLFSRSGLDEYRRVTDAAPPSS